MNKRSVPTNTVSYCHRDADCQGDIAGVNVTNEAQSWDEGYSREHLQVAILGGITGLLVGLGSLQFLVLAQLYWLESTAIATTLAGGNCMLLLVVYLAR